MTAEEPTSRELMDAYLKAKALYDEYVERYVPTASSAANAPMGAPLTPEFLKRRDELAADAREKEIAWRGSAGSTPS